MALSLTIEGFNMIRLKAALAGAMLSAAVFATPSYAAQLANTFNLGDIAPGATATGGAVYSAAKNDTFTDTWTFNFSSIGEAAAGYGENMLKQRVSGKFVRSYDATDVLLKIFGPANQLLASFDVGNESDFVETFNVAATGSYTAVVTGKVIGVNGQNYSLSMTAGEVAPVPEPGEWAMLLAGLAVVGYVGSRRKVRAIA